MWISWLEHGPIHQKVGLIPGEGTYLGCGLPETIQINCILLIDEYFVHKLQHL